MQGSSTKALRRAMKAENAKRPKMLTPLPQEAWPKVHFDPRRVSVWISQKYLVQAFQEGNGVLRLSVNRTGVDPDLKWEDDITWDQLQDIKKQVGFGDRCAVEVFPRDGDVVNLANMRHLWVLPKSQRIGWFTPSNPAINPTPAMQSDVPCEAE